MLLTIRKGKRGPMPCELLRCSATLTLYDQYKEARTQLENAPEED